MVLFSHPWRLLRAATLEALAFYARWTPIEKGRWRVWSQALELAQRICLRDDPRTIRTRHGQRMNVNLKEFIGRSIFATGEWEPMISQIEATILSPGTTMIDVGGHIGYFTLLASRCVGLGGRVITFEPAVHTRRLLESNLALNRLNNVTVLPVALSDRTGEIEFHEGPATNLGASSFRNLAESAGSYRVQCARFDEICPSVTGVKLVKIDVEGAELQVLRGMEHLLRTQQPDLVVEVTDEYLSALGASGRELLEFVGECGYHIYHISFDGLTPIHSLNSLDPWPWQFNAYCTTHTPPPGVPLKPVHTPGQIITGSVERPREPALR